MKINRYQYKCDKCGAGYIEQRKEDESQYITKCPCEGSFIEDSVTYVEDYVASIIEEVTTDEQI
jgi:peptide subunit release factor 1 (eRF1)